MRLLRLVILLVAAAIVVFPAGMALAYNANPVRALPATVERGATFNVTVNFTAPANNFTAISLTDFAPDGWNVTLYGAWCTPAATVKATGNMSEFSWYLTPYGNGTNFIVRYKVTVPCGAELENYTFGHGFLGYYIGNETAHIFENITGDFNVTVVPPAICFTPARIDFYAAFGGQNPEIQTLQLWSSTPCMINWSLSDDANYMGHDWLSENRTSGNCTNVTSSVALSVNSSVNSSFMPVGDYSANITIEAPYPEANNSPRIVPVSLHIRTTGTLKGHVNLSRKQPAGNPTWETPLAVRFFDNSTKLEMSWSPKNITTDAYGNFTIDGITVGTYDIGVKNWTALSEMNTGVTFTAGNVTWVNFGTLREGDCNHAGTGYDRVNFDDYIDIVVNYGMVYANGDFDRDGTVCFDDYITVLVNYGQMGDLYGK